MIHNEFRLHVFYPNVVLHIRGVSKFIYICYDLDEIELIKAKQPSGCYFELYQFGKKVNHEWGENTTIVAGRKDRPY